MFSELLSDYTGLISAVKGVFDHRMRCWQKMGGCSNYTTKKGNWGKRMVTNKPDKIQAKNDMRERENTRRKILNRSLKQFEN